MSDQWELPGTEKIHKLIGWYLCVYLKVSCKVTPSLYKTIFSLENIINIGEVLNGIWYGAFQRNRLYFPLNRLYPNWEVSILNAVI